LRAASLVSPKRTSSSLPSPGPASWTSPASTGSVGASTAASRTAAAGASPMRPHPRTATAAMVSGIVTASSRHVVPQRRHDSGRSIERPTPMIATMTVISVRRSAISPWFRGLTSGNGTGGSPTSSPTAANAMAAETARPRSSRAGRRPAAGRAPRRGTRRPGS
jgi:hypothetical protein